MGLIYLDTCVVTYLVEAHPVFGPIIARAIESLSDAALSISPLVKLECLVGPIRRANPVAQRAFEAFFARCVMVDMPAVIFDDAAILRARSGLRTPDALHLACAQHHQCVALWTHDDRLAQAGRGMVRNVVA